MKSSFDLGTAAKVPGGIYLCQVSQTVSCGACCGLYNTHLNEQIALTSLLSRRTDLFQETPRTPEALDDFAKTLSKIESQRRPFPDFHHCPYLGLIGEARRRVGCLLHPLGTGNQGVDYRGISYYGGMACRVFFCKTVTTLPARYKQILIEVADHWYQYGLVVTESDLIAALFGNIETRINQPLDPVIIRRRPGIRKALATLLALKVEWPFRPPHRDTSCHYLFNDDHYPKPSIDHQQLKAPASGIAPILFHLVSAFENLDQLRDAEMMVEGHIQEVVNAYCDSGPRQ
jgi:hypothetical protein